MSLQVRHGGIGKSQRRREEIDKGKTGPLHKKGEFQRRPSGTDSHFSVYPTVLPETADEKGGAMSQVVSPVKGIYR